MKKIYVPFVTLFLSFATTAQNNWTQKADIGGVKRDRAAAFSIGTKGYIGLGNLGSNVAANDLWEYDPATNTWTQKANSPTNRREGVSFSIGNYGYVGLGMGSGGTPTTYVSFERYDPLTNTWSAIANFPASWRSNPVGFSIGNKGYTGTGGAPSMDDFYEYDPATDTWTQKADFGAGPRRGAVGFSIGAKGYIATGSIAFSGTYENDIWEYDPGTDTWIQKTSMPTFGRDFASGFSIGNKGFVGVGRISTGLANDFWEYDPATDTWTQRANYSGGTVDFACGLSIGTKGYFGTGYKIPLNDRVRDFYEYTPICTGSPTQPGTVSGNITVCAGSSNTYSITSIADATSYTWTLPGGWSGASTTNSITTTAGTTGGTISVVANNSCGSSTAQTLNVTVNTTPPTPVSLSGNNTVCNGTSQTYSVTNDPTAISYTWTLPGGWIGTSTTNSITATAGTTGTISVVANNTCGSSTAQTLNITVNTAPATPASITGNTTVCSGTSQTYSVTNDPSATSYTWSMPSGWSGTSTTNTLNATSGTNSGNITVTANNVCGTSSAQTLNVTVNTTPATPSGISGTTTICASTNNTYSIPIVNGATSYTWSLPGGWTGTSTTNSINTTAGAVGGNITVTANNSCGNSTAQTLTITVNTVPVQPSSITGSTSVCQGSSQPYSVTNDPSATSYTWTLPATWTGSSITSSINSITGTSSGQITVVVNNACGSSAPQTINVTANSLPTVTVSLNTTSVCIDNAAFAFAGGSPSGGTFSGTGVTAGNFNAATAGVGTHTITYFFTDVNGCSNSNTDQITVNNCTGISESQTSNISVYPNPTDGIITLSGIERCAACSLIIYSMVGEIVYQSPTLQVNIDLGKVETGLYFLHLKNEDNTIIKKIIKN